MSLPTIRLGNNSDIEELINIAVTARAPLYPDNFKPIFNEYMINLFEVFKAIDKRITLIFCENYKSVGYLSFTNYIDRIEIDQLFVLPKYQKNGYGVKLVKECENLAKKMGVKKIIVASEHKALNFYERMDYKLTGETYKSILLSGIEYPYLEKNI
ncbi:GNAT family N-acetyltransferase [Silvanigrella sp.]|jgi:GNAT superfamily N-acetyltransferase|uniref:GNAT family N-acetyltransferase n=1 Tax=Silvanigrella sp. TaxID=2024976 RepID=UPI0037C75DC1